jgi:hypothetical protein
MAGSDATLPGGVWLRPPSCCDLSHSKPVPDPECEVMTDAWCRAKRNEKKSRSLGSPCRDTRERQAVTAFALSANSSMRSKFM